MNNKLIKEIAKTLEEFKRLPDKFSSEAFAEININKVKNPSTHKYYRCDIAKIENWNCCICQGCACQQKSK